MPRNKIIFSKEITQFLGMTIDRRLNWEEHIKKMIALITIRLVASKKWEGDQKTLKKLYSAICTIDVNYITQQHREGIRIYTGVFKTSPVEALHVKANNPPLELQRNDLILGSCIN